MKNQAQVQQISVDPEVARLALYHFVVSLVALVSVVSIGFKSAGVDLA